MLLALSSGRDPIIWLLRPAQGNECDAGNYQKHGGERCIAQSSRRKESAHALPKGPTFRPPHEILSASHGAGANRKLRHLLPTVIALRQMRYVSRACRRRQ